MPWKLSRCSLDNALKFTRWHLHGRRVLCVRNTEPGTQRTISGYALQPAFAWVEILHAAPHEVPHGKLRTRKGLFNGKAGSGNPLLAVNVHELELKVTVALLARALKQEGDRVSSVLCLQWVKQMHIMAGVVFCLSPLLQLGKPLAASFHKINFLCKHSPLPLSERSHAHEVQDCVDCYLHSDDVVIASALQALGHVCQIHACRQHLTSACPLQPPDTSLLLVNPLNTIECCSPMLMFLSHRK